MSSTLHIFIDEAGNPGFTDKARHGFLVFAVAWTYEPKFLSDRLTALRFRLLKEGQDLYQFHAGEDHDPRRQEALRTITAHRDWTFVACVIAKEKVIALERPISILYPKYLSIPLRYVLRVATKPITKKIIICTDNLPGKSDHKPTHAAIKRELGRELDPEIRYHLYHHPIVSNAGLQVADYCAWAVRRKWEDGKTDYYDQLKQHLALPEATPLG